MSECNVQTRLTRDEIFARLDKIKWKRTGGWADHGQVMWSLQHKWAGLRIEILRPADVHLLFHGKVICSDHRVFIREFDSRNSAWRFCNELVAILESPGWLVSIRSQLVDFWSFDDVVVDLLGYLVR